MDNFPDAIRKAIGEGVPCARPYTSIPVLQLIQHSHIEQHGRFRRKPVLTNPGNGSDTLINYIAEFDEVEKSDSDLCEDVVLVFREELEVVFREKLDVGLRKELAVELESLVNGSEPKKKVMNQLNMKEWAALKAGFNASISLGDRDLAIVGLKSTSDQNWSFSFVKDQIKKRSAPVSKLEQFLERNNIKWRNVMNNFKGVVTAIYYVSGGLEYIGDSESVTKNARKMDPNKVPVEIKDTDGWEYTVSDLGQVILSESNPRDWIIAIEYEEFE